MIFLQLTVQRQPSVCGGLRAVCLLCPPLQWQTISEQFWLCCVGVSFDWQPLRLNCWGWGCGVCCCWVWCWHANSFCTACKMVSFGRHSCCKTSERIFKQIEGLKMQWVSLVRLCWVAGVAVGVMQCCWCDSQEAVNIPTWFNCNFRASVRRKAVELLFAHLAWWSKTDMMWALFNKQSVPQLCLCAVPLVHPQLQPLLWFPAVRPIMQAIWCHFHWCSVWSHSFNYNRTIHSWSCLPLQTNLRCQELVLVLLSEMLKKSECQVKYGSHSVFCKSALFTPLRKSSPANFGWRLK